MKRVRMFCDWDNDSRALIERLKAQTGGVLSGNYFEGDTYKDITFVDDNSFTDAIVFNYPSSAYHDFQHLIRACLILEPPEIYAPYNFPGYEDRIWSFVDTGGIHKTAYGLGFATIPQHTKLISADERKKACMIVSSKVITPYHVKRHEIKAALLDSDLPIDFYGRGLSGVDPRIKGEIPPMAKYTVLPQYTFCIDFENSFNAVTDKYYDPIMCGTIPINNSPILHELAPWSAAIVDFRLPVSAIVDRIAGILDGIADDGGRYMWHWGYKEIVEGKMCLAEWIRQRVME